MNTVRQTTLAEIPKLAKAIAAELKGGEVLALTGQLGSGKTTFTKALGKQLKIRQTITSPTFVVMNRYPARLLDIKSKQKKIFFYHLDIYRCKNFREVMALGVEEFWNNKNSVTVIEWADKITKYLPAHTRIINFRSDNEHTQQH